MSERKEWDSVKVILERDNYIYHFTKKVSLSRIFFFPVMLSDKVPVSYKLQRVRNFALFKLL